MMVKNGRHLWKLHPHVDNELTLGERAADLLKAAFGTWSLLGIVAAWIIIWLKFVPDEGELHLNLALSCMAAVQGIILQIAANRGDRKAAQMALALHKINERQLEILEILNGRQSERGESGHPGKKGGEVE